MFVEARPRPAEVEAAPRATGPEELPSARDSRAKAKPKTLRPGLY
jgi:hypothetical protein